MKSYDCAVIGGGITGAASLYVLAKYTNMQDLLLVEKEEGPARGASSSLANSQTLHYGDIETNYTYDKAERVKEAAEMVETFVHDNEQQGLHTRGHKMVLAVGDDEVERLRARYEEFKELFPRIEWLDREEIREIEPHVVRSRDEDTKLRALYSDKGYRIDYRRVTQEFIEKAQAVRGTNVDVRFNEKVMEVCKNDGLFQISCSEEMTADGLVVAAGGYSLPIARSMGCGEDLMLLTVDGSYLTARNKVNGKVYMMQNPKLPFAAVHGDADVHHASETRFGPVSKMLPMMEKRNPETWRDFLALFDFRWDAFASVASILSDPTYLRYVFKQFLYAIPVAGKWFYMQEVKKIIPDIRYGELAVRNDLGEIRPQVVNIEEREIQLGEAKITEPGVVFDITPSPGASVCLKNAERNAKHIVNTLDEDYTFYYSKFNEKYK